MKFGFTGSRHGMTPEQRKVFIDIFSSGKSTEFHYGDCVGADEEALMLLIELGGGVLYSHPATIFLDWDKRWRANTADKYPELGITQLPAKHPLERNKDIVRQSDYLVACPSSDNPFTKSGTWSTIRYARSLSDNFTVILPNGRILRDD